ncbi:MAG TPA: hypothetical protein G4O17_00360 [Dehalococcoidia bacterium]|nr:hypothetical protein [Dehalococcoidia bacterium]
MTCQVSLESLTLQTIYFRLRLNSTISGIVREQFIRMKMGYELVVVDHYQS